MSRRYFTSEITDAAASVTGEDAAHLARVMRARPGDPITLCDGRGTDYQGQIASVNPDCVRVEILSRQPCVSEPDVLVTLYVGYPKSDKLEQIIQKAVELGAVRIVPFVSRYCVALPKNEGAKQERYSRVAREAAKQSGRGAVPKVLQAVSFQQMLEQIKDYDAAFFLYEAGGAPLHSRLEGVKNVAIISGAEGGFTPEEADAAARAGAVTVGLGPRILRCETAPVAALAVVMALTGNLQ